MIPVGEGLIRMWEEFGKDRGVVGRGMNSEMSQGDDVGDKNRSAIEPILTQVIEINKMMRMIAS